MSGRSSKTSWTVLLIAGAAGIIGWTVGRGSHEPGLEANAAPQITQTAGVVAAGAVGQTSPTKALKELDVYYPGTEDIGRNEMRIVALGTGMPSARPKQAAACFLVELGNGDKFLFDICAGSH